MLKRWTNVVFDDGEAIFWCTHWHDSAQEAHDCPWRPELEDYSIFILDQFNFDPVACTPCVHDLHPGECLRCLELECIHLNTPHECERCYEYQRLLQGQDENTNAGNSAGAEATGGPDQSGGSGGPPCGPVGYAEAQEQSEEVL